MSFIKNFLNIFAKPDSENQTVSLTTTDNGAITLQSSGDDLLNLFVATARGIDEERLGELMEKASDESMLYTLKILAYVRDIRGGKGERLLGRQMMDWLLEHDERQLYANMKVYIADYGRWDDGVYLRKSVARKHYVDLLANQLRDDLVNMVEMKSVSLAAKWVPSETSALNKKTGIFFSLAKNMGLKPAILRKTIISPLRKYIDVLERKMCAKEWDKVDYEKVPSVAMLKHGKPDHAFQRNDPVRFEEYKNRLVLGTAKINARAVFPHEILKQYLEANNADTIVESQWNEMVKKMSEIGCLDNVLVLSDVSGSMDGMPMLISYTMGLLISSLNTSELFKNQVLTFEESPQLVDVGGDSLFERLEKIRDAPWGGSTNICAAFQMLLEKVNAADATMPDKIIIVSDMQFNEADAAYTTNYESICEKFEDAGYDVPHIVFWNVNGCSQDFQVESNAPNVSMISGFSIDILKCVLEGKNPTPFDTMMAALNNPRYDAIRHVV
jgi:Mg-chelatase subunit ChlD